MTGKKSYISLPLKKNKLRKELGWNDLSKVWSLQYKKEEKYLAESMILIKNEIQRYVGEI